MGDCTDDLYSMTYLNFALHQGRFDVNPVLYSWFGLDKLMACSSVELSTYVYCSVDPLTLHINSSLKSVTVSVCMLYVVCMFLSVVYILAE